MFYGLQERRQLTGRWTETCRIRSCSGDSSGHSCRIFGRDDVCGIEIQKTNKIRGCLERCMSSIQLTMSIRNRHTPTTFTPMQLTMTIRNRHAPTAYNYPCRVCMDKGPGMLYQECKTRWSSTHAMGGILQQECKTRWSSTHAMGDSVMTKTQLPRLSSMVRHTSDAVPDSSATSLCLLRDSLAGGL